MRLKRRIRNSTLLLARTTQLLGDSVSVYDSAAMEKTCSSLQQSSDNFAVAGIATGSSISEAQKLRSCHLHFAEGENANPEAPREEISLLVRNNIVWGVDQKIYYTPTNRVLASDSKRSIEERYPNTAHWRRGRDYDIAARPSFSNAPLFSASGKHAGVIYNNCQSILTVQGGQDYTYLRVEEEDVFNSRLVLDAFPYCGKAILILRSDTSDGFTDFIQIISVDFKLAYELLQGGKVQEETVRAQQLGIDRENAQQNRDVRY